MVLVEIYVACLDKIYDFRLDKNVRIEQIIDEIITVVSQKEDVSISLSKEHMTLSIVDKETIMNKQLTLSDYNVVEGLKLILA